MGGEEEVSGLDFLDDNVAEDDPDYVPESGCSWCGGIFGPDDTGHCTGGAFGGCCQTFASNTAFDKHRTGKYDPPMRRCLTSEELTGKGWTRTGKYNAWRMPAPAVNPWAKPTT
jgi:hypothetical protein